MHITCTHEVLTSSAALKCEHVTFSLTEIEMCKRKTSDRNHTTIVSFYKKLVISHYHALQETIEMSSHGSDDCSRRAMGFWL